MRRMKVSRIIGEAVGLDPASRFGHSSFRAPGGHFAERLLRPTIGGAHTVAVLSGPAAARIDPVGWVICHAFGMEEGFLQPLEVELARRLAAAGSTVLRFHAQGYGDSDRLLEAVSVAGHIDDAVQAADVLRAETG